MANFDYNRIMLGGRLTGEPEMRTTASGEQVANFSLAVNRHHANGQSEATFFRVTAWRKNAEFVIRYFHKGDSIFITGRAENKKYTDAGGIMHSVCEVIAEEVKFVDGKKQESADPAAAVPAEIPDEDVPF